MSQVSCEVSANAIESQRVFAATRNPKHGGLCFFFGAVREQNGGKDVVAVEYDAAIPLAEKVLRDLADEAKTKWGQDLDLCVIHRIGRLNVGEVSVAIGVSSRHRDEAFQASRYVIEQIKLRVPIWKKEIYADGESEWLKGHALCQHG